MTHVRPATIDDVDTVSETVAAAFADDRAWAFMMGAGNRDAMRAFAHALLIPRLDRGTAWVAADGLAVSMWDRRGETADPSDEYASLWSDVRIVVGEAAWQRLMAYDEAVEGAAPERPFWYLGVLATHPEAQGRGLATAVLQPGFAAAAADGWDCWLETSEPANKHFYAGRGFVPDTTVDVPAGPTTWWLRRPHSPLEEAFSGVRQP